MTQEDQSAEAAVVDLLHRWSGKLVQLKERLVQMLRPNLGKPGRSEGSTAYSRTRDDEPRRWR